MADPVRHYVTSDTETPRPPLRRHNFGVYGRIFIFQTVSESSPNNLTDTIGSKRRKSTTKKINGERRKRNNLRKTSDVKFSIFVQ